MRNAEISEVSRLKAMVVNAVRSYLADYKSGDQLEAERLRELCSTLARFFGELVRGHEKWNRFYWVDDIVPLFVKVEFGSEVVLDGSLIWGQQKQSCEWREPFFASLKIAGTGDDPLEYRMSCGDANLGLGISPYRAEGLWTKRTPQDWIFTFVDGGN